MPNPYAENAKRNNVRWCEAMGELRSAARAMLVAQDLSIKHDAARRLRGAVDALDTLEDEPQPLFNVFDHCLVHMNPGAMVNFSTVVGIVEKRERDIAKFIGSLFTSLLKVIEHPSFVGHEVMATRDRILNALVPKP